MTNLKIEFIESNQTLNGHGYHIYDGINLIGVYKTEDEATAAIKDIENKRLICIQNQAVIQARSESTGSSNPRSILTDEEFANVFNRQVLRITKITGTQAERRAKITAHRNWLISIKAKINVQMLADDEGINDIDSTLSSAEREALRQSDKNYIPKKKIEQSEQEVAKSKLDKMLSKFGLSVSDLKGK